MNTHSDKEVQDRHYKREANLAWLFFLVYSGFSGVLTAIGAYFLYNESLFLGATGIFFGIYVYLIVYKALNTEKIKEDIKHPKDKTQKIGTVLFLVASTGVMLLGSAISLVTWAMAPQYLYTLITVMMGVTLVLAVVTIAYSFQLISYLKREQKEE